MKVLLDTHLLLWAASDSKKLPHAVRVLLKKPITEPVFSVASLWEVVIKSACGRSDFKADPRLLRRGLLDNGYEELPITSGQIMAVVDLPPIHRDPFDRLLIAQAISQGILFLTSDETLSRYPGPIRYVY